MILSLVMFLITAVHSGRKKGEMQKAEMWISDSLACQVSDVCSLQWKEETRNVEGESVDKIFGQMLGFLFPNFEVKFKKVGFSVETTFLVAEVDLITEFLVGYFS